MHSVLHIFIVIFIPSSQKKKGVPKIMITVEPLIKYHQQNQEERNYPSKKTCM